MITNQLYREIEFLNTYAEKCILISTTAKHALDFRVFPRRFLGDIGISSFMINNEALLIETLTFFDGKVNCIFIDVEEKQEINLMKISKKIIKSSKLIAVKPNDITLESTDLMVRNHCNDDLIEKNITVIGTGNLASKIAVRMAERQSNVYLQGRTNEKEIKVINALNLFLPKFTKKIERFSNFSPNDQIDIIISALSGPFDRADILYPFITEKTLIIDVGINNFSNNFIKKALEDNIKIVRLDTRIALPYQFLSNHGYVKTFFNEIFGYGNMLGNPIVSGGFIGEEGTVIVDNIKSPSQVVGVADGSGGVKKDGELSQAERNRIQAIQQNISKRS